MILALAFASFARLRWRIPYRVHIVFAAGKFPNLMGREFNPESATSAIKTNAENLNILHR
jgi:hypothetical protein